MVVVGSSMTWLSNSYKLDGDTRNTVFVKFCAEKYVSIFGGILSCLEKEQTDTCHGPKFGCLNIFEHV